MRTHFHHLFRRSIWSALVIFLVVAGSALVIAQTSDVTTPQQADCSGPLSSLNRACNSQNDSTKLPLDGSTDNSDVNRSSANPDLDGIDTDAVPNLPTRSLRLPRNGHPSSGDLRTGYPSDDDLGNQDWDGVSQRYSNQQLNRTADRLNSPRSLEFQNGRPQPSSEFQRFVESSTGHMLPIFGARLFEQAPSTFAPLERVPVTADYVIGPGDEILLRVWGQVAFNRQLTVDRSGAIYVPQVGSINIAGLHFEQLNSYLHDQLGRVFRNFEMNVNMGQLRSIQIFVMGQARQPGTYTVSSLSTVINALFAAGGPASQGSMRRIQLKRGSQIVSEVDLYDLLLRGDKSKDARLSQGDVIYIPPVGPQVAVAGSVKAPAIYELKSERTVEDLIRMACGITAIADTKTASLERVQDHASRQTITMKLEAETLQTPVQDGDVIRVMPILPRFANVVTLRGNVANPGRFGWHEGMKLRDIIPDKASLVTRNYWEKRNLLGYISPLEEGPAKPDLEAARKPAATKIGSVAPEINWSYAVIERQNGDLKDQLIPFNPGKLVLEGDETQNLPLEPGDVVTLFSQADFQVTVLQQTRYVRLEGEFNSAGVYGVNPGETLGQLIQRAGGLSPSAYLYGAQFLRKSVQLEQQQRLDQFIAESELQSQQTISMRVANASPEEAATLGARTEAERQKLQQLRTLQATGRIVLNLEPGNSDFSKLMNLQLEDGDRFIVPSRPATVNVIGAVYNQNSFLHEGDLRVRDYLEMAGGYTRAADKSHIYLIRADGSVVPREGHEACSEKRSMQIASIPAIPSSSRRRS
ncbi:MAG: SLBB domain-containing protein [Acidobacteriaceae bacterium]|nr:SLBB domain-containing protein [Acidobacteriaceae bacterium]